jgi:uncharacterized membrane protein
MDARKIRRLVYGALLTAIVATLTAYVKVPIPGGYFHPGDSAIALSAVLLGPWAAIPAALGSFLADALSGYLQYAPYTLVIKGLMGFVAGWGLATGKLCVKSIFSLAAAGAILVGGYFCADLIMGGVGLAWADLPWNALQLVIFLISGVLFMVTRISIIAKKL